MSDAVHDARRLLILRHVVHGLSNGITRLSELVIDIILVLQHERSQNLVVDDVRAAVGAGNHQPEEKDALGKRVERDPEEQLVAEELEDAEESVHAPVHEPLGVVILVDRLNRFD